METRVNQRIEWIDAVKGILILSIMFGHLGIDRINQIVFIYHVGGFFLLSGYTMRTRKVDTRLMGGGSAG